jgi:hypothetical protein
LDKVHLILYCVHLLLIFPFVIGPSITCERGSVVKLGLDSSELSGKIAPEISLLTNLVEYNSCRFHRNVFYTVTSQDYPKVLLVSLTHVLCLVVTLLSFLLDR